ncbi:hypothetical protein GGI07_001433 [Coemansia sp. Benny D115]|nr:hypothetical protein GGI07_001433 [Coemansia sp. Benny D115]
MQPSASHDYFVGIKQKMVSACRLPHDALSNWPCKSSYSTAAANYERMSTQSTEHTDCSSTTSTTVPTTPEPENVTYHMRTLPDSLVSFTSHKGRQLFKEALNEGYAEGYFNLAGNFTAQSEPAYCGPSSLAMVLNALEVDPKRTWKGVWRWYSDELLESCRTESEMKANGITFDQFFCLASSHAHVVAKRGREASREEFLRDIKYVTQRDDVFMVVSFARATLDQTGDGHFSPIGAYHPESNQALVLDSARYKYPSWFCDIDRLYDALQPVDLETNLPRGYFLISRLDTQEDKAPLSFSSRNAGPAESGFDEPAVVGAVQKGGDAGTLPLSSQHPASDAALLTKISCTKGHSTCCSNQPK